MCLHRSEAPRLSRRYLVINYFVCNQSLAYLRDIGFTHRYERKSQIATYTRRYNMVSSENRYRGFIIRILCRESRSKSEHKIQSDAESTPVNDEEENLLVHLFPFTSSSTYYDELEKSNQLVPLQNIAIGDFGVAKYSEDDHWYRARLIMCEGQNSIKIVYVDFGNIEIKSMNDFYPLHKPFTDLPAQAIACSLSEVGLKSLHLIYILFLLSI